MMYELPSYFFSETSPHVSAVSGAVPLCIVLDSKKISDQKSLSLLAKILPAIQAELDLEKVERVLLDGVSRVSIHTIVEQIKSPKVLVLGISPATLGLNLSPNYLYQPYCFKGKQLVFTHTLELLDANISLKKILWRCIQLHLHT